MINPLSLLPQVVAIARQAATAILAVYYGDGDWRLQHKSDASPITLADRASNDCINEGLQSLPGNYPVVSEENPAIPYEIRRHFHRFWLVDPLDGTREFVNRNDEFTVNIALIEQGRPVLGVVLSPVSGELFYAVSGQGAWAEKEGQKLRLQAAAVDLLQPGLRVLTSRSHLDAATRSYIATLNNPILLARGSSLKIAMLAAAKADLYPRLGPTSEWDTAAAQLLLEEAGGAVLNWHTGQPLHYNKEDMLNPFFLARGAGQP